MDYTTEKFDTLLENYRSFLNEEEDFGGDMGGDVGGMGDMGMEDPNAAPPVGDTTVSQGYAYIVNIIHMLLKFDVDNLDPKYYNLSDNKATDTETAYRYINTLTRLLPENIVADLKNDSFGGENEVDNITLDDTTLMEMANIAIKALFYSQKDSYEYSSKVDDIQGMLSHTDNKINVQNANAVYQYIKDLVGME